MSRSTFLQASFRPLSRLRTWRSALLLVSRKVPACLGGTLKGQALLAQTGLGRARFAGRAWPQTRRKDAHPSRPKQAARQAAPHSVRVGTHSGGPALLIVPSTSPGTESRSGRRGAERSAELSARSGTRSLPRERGEGGATWGQCPHPPAESAEKGEGEEARGSAAVLHGHHLRRRERSRHAPPVCPHPPSRAGTRGLQSHQPGPDRQRRQRRRRDRGAAGERGEPVPRRQLPQQQQPAPRRQLPQQQHPVPRRQLPQQQHPALSGLKNCMCFLSGKKERSLPGCPGR